MQTNCIEEDVPGGVPLKMWTRSVPVEDEATSRPSDTVLARRSAVAGCVM